MRWVWWCIHSDEVCEVDLSLDQMCATPGFLEAVVRHYLKACPPGSVEALRVVVEAKEYRLAEDMIRGR